MNAVGAEGSVDLLRLGNRVCFNGLAVIERRGRGCSRCVLVGKALLEWT